MYDNVNYQLYETKKRIGAKTDHVYIIYCNITYWPLIYHSTTPEIKPRNMKKNYSALIPHFISHH